MKTLKTILLMSMLIVLTTSCTDLTEDLVPNTNENTELTNTIGGGSEDNGDTGGSGSGGDGDTGKGGN